MDKQTAILGIFIEDREASRLVNSLLHDYSEFMLGRMGIPRTEAGVSVITLVMECSGDTLNALSGKLGQLAHVKVRSMMAK